ncbi:hypothetical protein [Brevundimonas sp.]|uniref:hypothetical protein n=1 Tax=Brevundimonas sp. TaxID=1871086 RepID=UPI002FCC0982
MIRSLAVLSVALSLTGGSAALAQAGPPPLRVKVLLASDPHLDAAARASHDALLQSLSTAGPGGGWFEILPTGLDAAEFEHCTISAQDTRTCARRQLAEQGATGATVIVLAGGEADHASWTCVGTGGRPTNPDRQLIRFDLNAGLDTASPKRMETRAAAAGCITGAGAESGW